MNGRAQLLLDLAVLPGNTITLAECKDYQDAEDQLQILRARYPQYQLHLHYPGGFFINPPPGHAKITVTHKREPT